MLAEPVRHFEGALATATAGPELHEMLHFDIISILD
jgi:hypothetical protein